MSQADQNRMTAPSAEASTSTSHITEDEASLYDRQIRLWGLEAQNRMRGSTVLVLGLRGVAHETIKNVVLAGIGRLIVMDSGAVAEEDLGSGFLFREEEGAVGTNRTQAASPQIASLNPLVSLTALPTLAPFVLEGSPSDGKANGDKEMVEFLKREKVDVLVACDLGIVQNEAIDAAARAAGTMFYASSTYGFYGYVFADLGETYDYVYMPAKTTVNPNPTLTKKTVSFPSLSSAVDAANWHLPNTSKTPGRSPYRDLTRQGTANRVVFPTLEVLALWEFERQRGRLPTNVDSGVFEATSSNIAEHEAGARANLQSFHEIREQLSSKLGVNEKARPAAAKAGVRMPGDIIRHAMALFPPTLAIVGGLLAQDVLRALSHKDQPITNLLVIDTMETSAVVERWGMADTA